MEPKPKDKKVSVELGRLENIVAWFEEREDVDVEEGLLKVKEAAEIIRDLKTRLKDVENEFTEVKKDLIGGEDD